MRRWQSHVVFLLAAAAFAGATLFVLRQLARPAAALERKVELADRVLYYRLVGDADVTFQLNGGEQVVKLLTHAIVAGNRGYDPADRFEYGVRCELRAPGGELLWSSDVWTRSRQSKGRLLDGVWMQENAFSLEPGVEVADDRSLLVALPDLVPVGARLRLSKLGSVDEVVVRAYRRATRSGVDRQAALRSMAPGERDELIARTTYSPWDLVPVWERLERLRYRFERLAAVGDSGADFLTRPVWFTGFRTPTSDAQQEAEQPLLLLAAAGQGEVEQRQAFVLGPWPGAEGAASASFTIQTEGAGANVNARAFRLIARRVVSGGPAGGPPDVAAVVRFVDAQGAVVSEERVPIPADDGAVPVQAPELDAGVLDREARLWPVGPEADVRIVAPRRARGVEVTSEGGAIAARALLYLAPTIEASLAAAPAPEPPAAGDEASADATDAAARFWFTVVPNDIDSLVDGGREVRLLWQPQDVGLEPDTPVRRSYRSLAPIPKAGERIVFEPVKDVDRRADVVARWPAGSWTEVANTRVWFAAAGANSASVRYAVAPDDVGAELTVLVDGIEVARGRARGAGGRLRLPPVDEGRRAVQVRSDATSLRAFIDRPPAGPRAGVWRARTVYPLGRAPLKVRFRGAGIDRVSVRVYGPAQPLVAPALRFTLDGGNPTRVESRALARYTIADRVERVPPSDRPLAQFFPGRAPAGHGRVVSVPIGDDLAAGPHVLELRNLSEQRLWVSFFATDYADGGTP